MPPLTDLPPELANHPHYSVERELGRGGMGVVYLARNTRMNRREVLKVISVEALTRPGARARFLREIQSAARLHHPNVVTAFSVVEVGHLLALAMEYVDGPDLSRVVKDRGPLPVTVAVGYARQALAGLQHAHDMGLVHRDIKPANLILKRAGGVETVKVLDFGLAKATAEVDSKLTAAGQVMGTPSYMAPEQTFDTASADIRADVYAVGCTLTFLLTGAPPFSGGPMDVIMAHRGDPPPDLTGLRPDVHPALAAVVARMLAKEPTSRFPTPDTASDALLPFADPPAGSGAQRVVALTAAGTATRTVTLASAGTATSAPPRKSPWPLVAGGVVGLAVVGVVAGLLLGRGGSSAAPVAATPPTVQATPTAAPAPTPPTAKPAAPPTPPTPKKVKPLTPVVSKFAPNDTEGWTTSTYRFLDAGTDPPKAQTKGDNTWLHVVEQAANKGRVWGFRAPPKFHGNHSDKYGAYLRFNLWTQFVDPGPPQNEQFVRFRGGGAAMYFDGNKARRPTAGDPWTSYAIRLHESESWWLGNGLPAAEADIRRILADVRDLWIQGKFAAKKGSASLDGVVFGAAK